MMEKLRGLWIFNGLHICTKYLYLYLRLLYQLSFFILIKLVLLASRSRRSYLNYTCIDILVLYQIDLHILCIIYVSLSATKQIILVNQKTTTCIVKEMVQTKTIDMSA